MSDNDFLTIIKKQRDGKKVEKFSGTFIEYLELVKENPGIVTSAHKRLYDAIMEHGLDDIPDSDPRKR